MENLNNESAKKNKISASEFYDQMADDYDQLAASNTPYLDEAVKLFKKYNHTDGTILDIGCGTGMLSLKLKGDFKYTGIEPSKEMTRQAKARGYEVTGKEVEEALGEIPDLSYDHVVALGCLFYVKDVETVLNEMRRIARKSFMVTFDDVPREYIDNFSCQVYNHCGLKVDDALESYRVYAWQSPTLGTDIYCRVIYGAAPTGVKPTLLDSEPFYYAKKYAAQHHCDLAIASNIGLGSLVCFSPIVEAMARKLGRPIRLLTTHYKYYENERLKDTVAHPIWHNNPYIAEIVDSDKIDPQIMTHLIRESHNFCQSKNNIQNMLGAYGLKPRKLQGDLYLTKKEMQWAMQTVAHLPRPLVCICPYGQSASLKGSSWYLQRWQQLLETFNGKASFIQVGGYGFEDKDLDAFNPQTNIRQLMALIWAGDLYIGFDGGSSHIATALEKPVVVLWDAVRKVALEEGKCEGFSTAMINRWAYPQNENLMILGERNNEILQQCIEFIARTLAEQGFDGFSYRRLLA